MCLLVAPIFVDAQLLEWNEFYRLTWEDFQGNRTSGSIGDAGTVVHIKAKPYFVGKKISYDVYAYFDRGQSWSIDQSPALLAHEQLHFDIAELYARKIRKQILTLTTDGVNDADRINTAIRALLDESNEIDKQYDAETLHGSIPSKQAKWQAKIATELRELKRFKKPKKVIRINR